jgi:SAM-dependent methyltransferase
MRKSNAAKAKAGAAIYSRPVLFLYDWVILGNNCRFLWGCPAHHMLDLYNKCVSSNHLDIGVGTGFFMDRCKFPTVKPRLALMDLNQNSLRAASKRLTRYNPEVYQRNVLEPFNIDNPAFDSVGIMNLLHCLPGNMDTKQVVFENAKAVMSPGAVLFGSTILPKGIKRNPLAALVMKINNSRGIWSNLYNDLDGLQKSLSLHFRESSVRMVGCEALFWARK